MTVLRTLPILLWLASSAGAQATRTPKPPTSAEQKEMLALLRTNLAEYQQHMPGFVCLPAWKLDDSEAPQGSRDPRTIVVVELGLPERGKPDGSATSFAVEPLIRGVLPTGAKFGFERWATLRKKQVAIYRYKRKKSGGGIREAEIYLDRKLGTISRIVFPDLNTPEHVPLLCRPEQTEQK